MDSASKNAGDMIGTLQMQYNRGRQAAITNELVDIITGSSSSCRFALGIPDTCLRCQRLVISENSLEWNRFCLWVQPCDLSFSYLLSGYTLRRDAFNTAITVTSVLVSWTEPPATLNRSTKLRHLISFSFLGTSAQFVGCTDDCSCENWVMSDTLFMAEPKRELSVLCTSYARCPALAAASPSLERTLLAATLALAPFISLPPSRFHTSSFILPPTDGIRLFFLP